MCFLYVLEGGRLYNHGRAPTSVFSRQSPDERQWGGGVREE